MIIIVIAWKGASRDSLESPHYAANVSNTYAQVARAQSCANHMQHIEHSSRVTCRVLHGMEGQLSYAVEIAFI